MSWKAPPPKKRHGRGLSVTNNGVYVRVVSQGAGPLSIYTTIGAGAAQFLGLAGEVEHVAFLFGEGEHAGKIALRPDPGGETARRQVSGTYLIISRSKPIIDAIGRDAEPHNVPAERDTAQKMLIIDAPRRPEPGAAKVACKILEDTPEVCGTAREAPTVALLGATPRLEERTSPISEMGGMAEPVPPVTSPSYPAPKKLIDLRAAPSSMETFAIGQR